MHVWRAILLLLSLLAASPVQAASISMATWPNGSTDPWPNGSTTELRTRASSDRPSTSMPGGTYRTTLTPSTIPFTTEYYFDQGNARNRTAYDLAGQYLRLDFLEHTFSTDSAAEAEGSIYFTVDADIPYQLSGEYLLPAISGGRGGTYFGLTLTEWGTGHIFDHRQSTAVSYSPAELVLGEEAEATSSILSGSLTGALHAGAHYRLHYRALAYSNGNSTFRTGTGFLLLAIPEPSTAAMLGLGLIALGAMRRHD